jgi:protein ImuB
VEPALAGVPLATWAQDGSRWVLVAVDATRGLHPGQALADARAIRPDLVLRPADPDGDAAELGRLALWALRFTPLAGTDPPDGLLLDVTGCAHLFAGEAALLHEATEGLARLGFDATAALADAPDAAAALARCGRHGAIVPPGEEAAAVAPLPLAAALRLAPDTAAALHRLGLRRVGDLLRLPRGPLARRFGQDVLDALDAATGARPRPIQPVRPPPALAAARDFAEPIATRAAIDAAVDALLGLLCGALRDAGRGARRVALRAFRVDGAVQEVAVGTGVPTREPAHLRRLFAERLERLEPDLGFERMTMEARVAEPLAAAQAGMVAAGDPAGNHGDDVAALARLLDRLAQRLAVWRLAPRASHWPERAVVRVGPFEHVAVPPGWPGPAALLAPRPVRLLRRPLPLTAVALLPDAPPALLRFGGEAHRVARADGPERIEPEWWRDDDRRLVRPFRDYCRLELASGARLWVCRVGLATPERPAAHWVLHGRFA